MSEILDKIRKLYDKANSAKELGSVAEYEAFMLKVNKLLIEHQLEMADLKKGEDRFRGWCFSEPISYACRQGGNRWKMELFLTISRFNLTKNTSNRYLKLFRFYGSPEAVETSVWLYNFLSTQLISAGIQYRKENQHKLHQTPFQTLKSFLIGAVVGLDRRFERDKNESEIVDQINALIVHNDAALDEFLKKERPDIKAGKALPLIPVANGFSSGIEFGKNVSIGGKLQSAKAAERKLIGG